MRRATGLRSRPVAETIAIAEALMPLLGIRAVVDATGIDRIGLPVFFSIRRRTATRRIHSGKGLTAADARVGALMETIELAVAEGTSANARPVRMTVGELIAQLPGRFDIADLAPRLGAGRDPSRPLLAVRCENIATAETALLPAELALVPGRVGRMQPLFGWSSNGLASGNTRDEATLHGLLEVLERDTLAMNLAKDGSFVLANEDLPPPFANKALEWQRIGIGLVVRFVPNAFELPCFEAALHDRSSRALLLARGSGLHFEKEIALARAVCEAAQSRARVLYGLRPGSPVLDAATAEPLRAIRDKEVRILERLRSTTRRIDFDAVPDRRCCSIAAALHELVARLAAAGLAPIYRHEMDPTGAAAASGLHVVKVIVPRSESIVERHVRMGPRLLERVLRPRR
ncbi:MAG TPA: YcaO-like family protein [Caldimonas sp.]|jgi:ribosomal protein S12 methylthiotransferase accessory factor